MEDLLGKLAGSHHGTPDLFDRDIKLLTDYQKWVATAKASGGEHYKDFTPSYVDMLKSRLFWRIRSGKEPLPEAPPTAYSCPWYELIEVAGPHDVWEEIRVYEEPQFIAKNGPVCTVAQSIYSVLEKQENGTLILKYNCYKFKAWNGMVPTRSLVTDAVTGEKKVVDTQNPGGWIEYIGTV